MNGAIRLGLLFTLTAVLSGCSLISIRHCSYWNILPALGINFVDTVCPGGTPTLFERPKVEPIRLDVAPRVSANPVTSMHWRVWIEPDHDNRSVTVRAESERFFRSTGESLDGEYAPKSHEFWWRILMPCGHYELTAETRDQSGRVNHRVANQAEFCPQEGL